MEHPRIYGESNLQELRDGWRILKVILRERFSASRVDTRNLEAVRVNLRRFWNDGLPGRLNDRQ
jgi:hypothetical protein